MTIGETSALRRRRGSEAIGPSRTRSFDHSIKSSNRRQRRECL